MNQALLISFLSYAIVTTITPGPNNITATSAGMKLNYKGSVPYLLGIALGFFIVMLIAGSFTSYFTSKNNQLFDIIKWFGAAYILYLALIPFLPVKKKSRSFNNNYSFVTGLGLQMINPKVILYGVTIYSSFNHLIGSSMISVVISSVFLSSLAFVCTSIWAILGTTLFNYFENKTFYYVFNSILALLLVYIAITILLL
ncbi:LysE family translocator [Marinifilum caeruleilacunae]|uniref:Lysine transporter LysE n=1 Tax=Marinifilum caeruleilacunae TaxID=2499076 RepID=A0ABX1WR03_9BACT|nr:LysE family transporter [Marinifilum caeruleilacunae]NOU58488.1 lysine transporter LysE [Marinifilum caeruleilacunae]